MVRQGERQADKRDSVTIFKFSLQTDFIVVKQGERHADKRDSVTIFKFLLQTDFNLWLNRGKGTRIKGTVLRYSHFHYWLQLVVRQGERHADKRDSISIFKFLLQTDINLWLNRGKGTRIKGTVLRYSHFHYCMASTGGQAGGKARR